MTVALNVHIEHYASFSCWLISDNLTCPFWICCFLWLTRSILERRTKLHTGQIYLGIIFGSEMFFIFLAFLLILRDLKIEHEQDAIILKLNK